MKIPKIDIAKKRYSVQVHLEGEHCIFYAVLSLYKDNSLEVLEQKVFRSRQQLFDYLSKSIPVILTLTGDKVIAKNVVNKTNYLQEVLFTSNPEDFYIYSRPQAENRLVAVVRKSIVKDLLEVFSAAGIAIIDLLVGPWSLISFSALFESTTKFITPEYEFDFNTCELVTFEGDVTQLTEFVLEDNTIYASSAVGFASLVHHFTIGNQYTNYSAFVTELKERFTFKQLTKKAGIVTVAFLFLSLALSYSLSAFYAQKNANIQTQLNINTKLEQQITNLETDIANKETIVSAAGLGSGTYLSQFVWEIAQSVPDQIGLSQTQVFPLIRKIKEGEAIVFTQNQIMVSGMSNEAMTASDWVAKLKTIQWVKTVEFIAFNQIGNNYEFTLKIEI